MVQLLKIQLFILDDVGDGIFSKKKDVYRSFYYRIHWDISLIFLPNINSYVCLLPFFKLCGIVGPNIENTISDLLLNDSNGYQFKPSSTNHQIFNEIYFNKNFSMESIAKKSIN
tara:strand:+ start:97 stop:438 length:342 start_codon:yes stop_codon:yes gene_type:complete